MSNGESSYRRFLSGDDEALTSLVETYKDGLILYLNSYVSNIYLAEELAAETFFRLIVKKPKFSGKSAFKSWLYAIGRNVAVDYIRQKSKLVSKPIEDLEGYINDCEGLEQSYIKEETKITLHRAISQLSPDYKAVLWLSFFEGFKNREIALIMKKNDRQVKNLLYRAKESLKFILEKEGFNYEKL